MSCFSKERFDDLVSIIQSQKGSNSRLVTREDYNRITERLVKIASGEKKNLHDFRLLTMYEIANCGDDKYVLLRAGTAKRVACKEELFDIISSAHQLTGHGGRDSMRAHLAPDFHNITNEMLEVFGKLCEPCQRKRSRVGKGMVVPVRPILSNSHNSRCQVGLIDFQGNSDGQYRFIMNYQDHLTQFCCLKPLKTKTAEEVAENLVHIFCQFGAPSVFQSDNGREFDNKVVTAVSVLWQGCKIVHGKPRGSQSQDSVERANRDIQDKLACFLRDNPNRSWDQALPFVQFQKNTSYHSGIGRTPYEAMFGSPAKLGLSTAQIPPHILSKIVSEEDLEELTCENQNHSTLADDTVNGGSLATSQVQPQNVTPSSHWNSKFATTAQDMQLEAEDEQVTLGFVSKSNKELKESNASTATTCTSCDLEVNSGDTCQRCAKCVHHDYSCSVEKRTDTGRIFYCLLCYSGMQTETARGDSEKPLESRAQRMLKRSRANFKPAKNGTTVLVPLPDLDRERGDSRNVIGVLLGADNNCYRIGTPVSLRESSLQAPSARLQGFFRCNCTTKCQTSRCKCTKNSVLCNSKCHQSTSCCNK